MVARDSLEPGETTVVWVSTLTVTTLYNANSTLPPISALTTASMSEWETPIMSSVGPEVSTVVTLHARA